MNSQGSVLIGEGFRDGNVLDFAGPLLCSSAVSAVNVSFAMTDGAFTRRFAAVKEGAFDAVFVTFTVSESPCYADVNFDGVLDPDDLADFIGAYFAEPPSAASDFNADGTVNPDDLADFIGAYFAGC